MSAGVELPVPETLRAPETSAADETGPAVLGTPAAEPTRVGRRLRVCILGVCI